MTKQLLALTLCAALVATGCATAGVPQTISASPTGDRLADRAVMAEYVQKLPAGATVRIQRTGRRTLRATLMKVTGTALYVQPRTRIAEPAIEIPLDEIVSVTLENSSGNGTSIGKAIAAGAAAGAGVVLAMILISLALWSD